MLGIIKERKTPFAGHCPVLEERSLHLGGPLGDTFMNIRPLRNGLCAQLFAGLIVFLGVPGFSEATTLYGGGAALPAGPLVGYSFLHSNTPFQNQLTLPNAVAADSLLGAWSASTANQIQYCQVNSGFGKLLLDGVTTMPPISPYGLCGNLSGTAPTSGFNIPTTATNQPDFVASSVPMSASEYSAFIANEGVARGEPVEFPALVQSLAIVYNNPTLPVGQRVNLTSTQVCGIFSGAITNWNQLNASYASALITVLARSDGNGATFNLMNHLSATCGTIAGGHFITDQVFSNAIALLPLSHGNWSFNDGEQNLLSTLKSTAGSISYAATSDILQIGGISYAYVDAKDPVLDLAAIYNFGAALFDQVWSGVDVNGRPILTPQAPSTNANCLAVIDPASYAIPQPVFPAGYPILAVSYLLTGQPTAANIVPIRSLLATPYGSHAGVTTVGVGTGAAFIAGSNLNALRIALCTKP